MKIKKSDDAAQAAAAAAEAVRRRVRRGLRAPPAGGVQVRIPRRVQGRLPRHERPLLIDEMDLVIEKLCRREVVGYSATHPDPECGDGFGIPPRGSEGEP